VFLITAKASLKFFRYVDLEQELVEDEKIEALLQAETLKKAEDKLAKLEIGQDDKSPVVEKIGEAFHEAKDFTKHMLGNVGKEQSLMGHWVQTERF
jgi:hypothetical protein